MGVRKRPLLISDILAWADTHRETTGKWPTKDSGGVIGAVFETWLSIDNALRKGLRGLPAGSSLSRLLSEQRGVHNRRVPLTEAQILEWADAHFQRTGSWPTTSSGAIPNSNGENWAAINVALHHGVRGLPGGSSLARLLAAHRGVRNRKQLRPLTEDRILAWADRHREQTGSWPSSKSGAIAEAPGETWMAVEMALRHGQRGLPGGSSLTWLLAEKRGAENAWTRRILSVEQILAWADAFHERTGKWPNQESGPIQEAPGETWNGVNHALQRGSRGLPGGLSLAKLLAAERGVHYNFTVSRLSTKQILSWAKSHFRREGKWPTADSGLIPETTETWRVVNAALRQGSRGLRGGSSLARLLAKHVNKRNHYDLPRLSQKKILAWADAHFERSGQWPNINSGPVAGTPGEKWRSIDNALRLGQRGLPGGSSVRRLLVRKRGLRDVLQLPPLTEEQILDWAELHFDQAGRWPTADSGPVFGAPGETWANVDYSFRCGKRGLAGGSSLAKLLASRRSRNSEAEFVELGSR